MTHEALIKRLQISCLGLDAIDPLRLLVDDVVAALAQPEQEPVAWAHYDTFKNLDSLTTARFKATLATKNTGACCIALYTTPPQRTWEGLSVFEINDLVESTEYEDYQDLVERTEAKLKELNDHRI